MAEGAQAEPLALDEQQQAALEADAEAKGVDGEAHVDGEGKVADDRWRVALEGVVPAVVQLKVVRHASACGLGVSAR